MSLTKATYSMINGAVFNVFDYGAVGDGIADDTAAIEATIAAAQLNTYGGEIYFPPGNYKITDTIEVVSARNIRFTSSMGAVNPSSDDVKNTRIFWAGANSTDPIFYFSGGSRVEFNGIVFDGTQALASTNIAFVGVWVDEQHTGFKFYNCMFRNIQIGVRVCSGYNFTTTAWTPGYSAYNGAYNAGAAAVGGYQSDNHYFEGCTFATDIAGISFESSQSLDNVITKCEFYGVNRPSEYSVFIAASQGIQFISPTFLGASIAEIYLTYSASTGNIIVDGAHQEQGAEILFEIENDSASLGTGNVFRSCGGGDINVRGSTGFITIDNCNLRTVSMKSAGAGLIVRNSKLSTLNKTVSLGPGAVLNLENCEITTATAQWNNYVVSEIKNCTIGSWTDLKYAQKISPPNYTSGLVIGPIFATSTVDNMEGVTFSCVNDNGLFLGYGAYMDGTGTIIATNAAGGYAIFTSTGISLKKFTGQTIGTTPVVTAGAYA
jgi:hypothetical protein